MNRVARSALLLFVFATTTASACRRPKQEQPAPAQTVNQDSINAANRARQDSLDAANAARARSDSIARMDQMRRDSLDRIRADRERMMTEARNAIAARIYFDYNAAELSDEARSTLDAKVPLLNANPGMRIRVAGHTDDRGSDEYNLGLGQRRAAAAKRYLVQRGVDAGRIEIISYGEEQPATQGGDESAWQQNRRAEFEITAGGDTITLPNR